MKTLVVNIVDDIDVSTVSAMLKKFYPTLHVEVAYNGVSGGKKFSGVGDLKPLIVKNFKMYPREELYDR